jgi:cell division protein FtsB
VSEDKVIHAFPSRDPVPECPVDVKQRTFHCRHEKVSVDENIRMIVCTQCEARIDPFDYLRGEAYALRRGWQDYQSVVAATTEKRAACEKLEKERKRLQAQVKRLRDKAPASDTLDMRRPL